MDDKDSTMKALVDEYLKNTQKTYGQAFLRELLAAKLREEAQKKPE